MPKEATLKAILVVQQLEDEHWPLLEDKTVLQIARKGNCQPLLEVIVNRLNEANIKVEEAYGILHNKDVISIWNPIEMKNIDEPKANHIHFLFKFEKGASLQKLALIIGVESQYLEKLKSGRYGYENCLAYLVHAKDETKYQYQPNEVVTILGEDYTSLYHRKMQSWVKGRATKKAKETTLSIDWLIEKILAGEVTKSNILLTNEYYVIYGQHKRKINEALDTAGERKSYQTIAELEAGKFKKTILFISANSGAGKTQYSKKLIGLLQKVALKYGKTWDFCVTASTNAFDEYNGQEILFLDDIRGDSLTVSDWLKLLDPYMISPISARYHNKMGSAKVIIITSTKKPIAFFEQARGNTGEDLGQFIRRIDYLLKIHDDDNFELATPIKNSQKLLSYCFSQSETLTRNKALNRLVKTVIKNNKTWNQKKVINASDQTNSDNPNTQQK